ncbi:helix-turn-helix domain-containing protein [Nocardiopsis sp. NPDC006832]|uniref:ArsR/SmtB family transcription factor n=1 Tax=Nocardiopsis sp. NPDC006832 TaxID=3157188 RepID=UPI0033C32153
MSPASEPRTIDDPSVLKSLAHPRRQRILARLSEHGAATSASLARELGLNTGATSYHLRELARNGLVEETDPPEGSHGRERWWRTPRHDLRFPPRSAQEEAFRQALDEYARATFTRDFEDFNRALEATAEDGTWGDAFPFSSGSIQVTPEELSGFFEEYIALLKRYQRAPEQTPEGARTIVTRFLAFPTTPDSASEPENPPERT